MSDDLPLPYHPIPGLARMEAIHAACTEMLPHTGHYEAASLFGQIAGVEYTLGNGEAALSAIRTSIHLARETGQIDLLGYLLNLLGAIQAYQGQYGESCQAFEQAEAFFMQTGDVLGMAWKQQLYAREYARDTANPTLALTNLNSALPTLRSRGNAHAVIENLLTQADCYIRVNEMRRAADSLRQAEGLLNEHKAYWFQPEYYLLRAQLALAEGNMKTAWQNGYYGLGAVGNAGDLRMLTPLYLTLGLALESDRKRLNDARDALDRAINSGRKRARRLHLTLAVRHMGLHLKRFSNRPTARARGSGFLFEASRMLNEMGLTEIYTARGIAGD